jgi:predicted dehydrogenase
LPHPMAPTYRAVLVGTGAVADSHARAIEATRGRVTLVGAVDTDAERAQAFCARHKLNAAFTDYRVALRDARPNLVLVVSRRAPMRLAG